MNNPSTHDGLTVAAKDVVTGSSGGTSLAVFNKLPMLVRSFLLMVGLPTLVGAIYFGLVASDIYVSSAHYSIRSSDRPPAGDLLSSLFGPGGVSAAGQDAKIVRDYILSHDMLEQLQTKLDLRAHYGAADVDWFFRLPRDASEEKFLKYYRKMIEISIPTGSDITVLRTRAFDPEVAQQIAQHIIAFSEVLINNWSERITEDTLRFSREELSVAEDRVRATSAAVTRFRNDTRSIDPGEETSAVLQIITGLESQLAGSQTELIELQSFMRDDSGAVVKLKSRVVALRRQIDNERARLAGKSGTELTRLIVGYEPLILDHKIAEKRYSSALGSMEIARAEAQRKQRYLIAFVSAELPDEALEPERLWNVFTIFAGSLLLFGIASLAWGTINDHVGL